MGILGWVFDAALGKPPLEKRLILEVASGFMDDDMPEKQESRAVNFQSYVDTGGAPYNFSMLAPVCETNFPCIKVENCSGYEQPLAA